MSSVRNVRPFETSIRTKRLPETKYVRTKCLRTKRLRTKCLPYETSIRTKRLLAGCIRSKIVLGVFPGFPLLQFFILCQNLIATFHFTTCILEEQINLNIF